MPCTGINSLKLFTLCYSKPYDAFLLSAFYIWNLFLSILLGNIVEYLSDWKENVDEQQFTSCHRFWIRRRSGLWLRQSITFSYFVLNHSRVALAIPSLFCFLLKQGIWFHIVLKPNSFPFLMKSRWKASPQNHATFIMLMRTVLSGWWIRFLTNVVLCIKARTVPQYYSLFFMWTGSRNWAFSQRNFGTVVVFLLSLINILNVLIKTNKWKK